jgi:hypothetical protein
LIASVVKKFEFSYGGFFKEHSTLSQPRGYLTSTSLRELALQVEMMEVKHRMLLISSTQQLKHGALQH